MRARVRYEKLPTEQRNPKSRDLDKLSTTQLLRLMNREDLSVVHVISRNLPAIARAVNAIAASLRRGGQLFFVGAGTSGRLGVIEAAECPPTFHTQPSMVQALIAGGNKAVFRSQEGSEDDLLAGRKTVQACVRKGDVVVGIAASGVTPFVQAALAAAKQRGAKTILVTCSTQSTIPAAIRIVIPVGPEVLTGSTRLKAGTATKLVLNMLTLGSMVRLGKTYGNLMVDVRPASRKLKARAVRMLQLLTHTSTGEASGLMRQAHGRVKAAVVMHQKRLSYRQAMQRISKVGGSLRRALTR